MKIKEFVQEIVNKYGTRNPYTIAKALGISIIYEDLGTIRGYYNKQIRDKQIHINHYLNADQRIFTMSHELGHALMHPNVNTPFLANSTLMSVNKLEIEANTFAMHILLSDEEIAEYNDYCIPQLSILFGYDEELIRLRLR